MITADRTKKRQRGNPKPMVAFRCPDDLLAYFAEMLTPRDDRSELIIRMLRVARDCSKRMGDDWWEVDRRANVAKRSPGEVLAELALAGIRPGTKPRRK